MSGLAFSERPAAGAASGLLVLHHGRGTDDHDVLPLADALDPAKRLHVVTPRAPLQLPGSPGRHWYLVSRVGYPDPASFRSAFAQLAALHDELWQRTGIGPERTVLGGFSMGTAMSYALGLDGLRPAPGESSPSLGSFQASTDGSRTWPAARSCPCSSPTAVAMR